MRNTVHSRLLFLAILPFLVCFIHTRVVNAQLKIDVDEEVKIPFLGDWHDGVVVDKDKKQLLVEFKWANSQKRKVFHRNEIRKKYEYQGLDFGRIWESASGQFKVEATLLRIEGENVVLLKPDMNEITVPLSKLCTRDNGYVKKFNKQFDSAVKRGEIPAATQNLPPIENFDSSFGETSIFADSYDGTVGGLGEIPSFLRSFTQNGLGFDKVRNDQKLVAVIPVGGPEEIVLMSFREKNAFGKPPFFQSQLYWISLKQQKVTNTVAIPHEDYAIDYEPRYKRLLTFNRKEEFFDKKDEPDHYTLWNLAVNGDKAEPLLRWQASSVSWASSQFGKIVNDRVVVIKTDKKTYEGYDVIDKKRIYTVKPKSFFSAPVVISPDRKHLILPEDGQVSVANAETGEFVFTFNVNDRHVSGANINSAGTRLAAITERNVYIWDLESGSQEPKIYPAPLMGSPFSSRIEFIGDDYVLGESHQERILYQLSKRIPVWSYEMDVRQYFLNRDPLKNMVVDGMLFYVAEPDVWGKTAAVGAVELPGPGVAEATQNVEYDALLIMKPGVSVSIDASEVDDPSQVESWLREKIDANEWIYDPQAEIKLVAKMGIGENQTIEYEEIGSRKTTTVSFRPHYSRLKLVKGSLIIWQTGTSTGAPSFIRAKNVQAEVNKYQNPQLNFFKGVKIDKEIIDPQYSRGFGKSKLGLRGIEVVSSNPPGREDDPLAAAQQADEDQKKAAEEKPEEGDKQSGQSNATDNTGN